MKKLLSIGIMLLLLSSLAFAQEQGCISGNCDNGYGTWVYKNGDRYTGTWVNKKMHGQGVYHYLNGDVYKGSFVQDKLSGNGTFISHKGDKYVGQYRNNKMEGEGTYFYQSGKVEEGLFANNRYVGDGNSPGCISGDCENGKGIYLLSNGDKYEGYTQNGMRSGKGTYYFSSGERYRGYWQNNKRNGYGTNYYPDGEKYKGNWKDDKRNGYGTYTYVDGSYYSGMWEMGVYVGTGQNSYGCISGDCNNGYGVYRWKGGQQYEGWFKNGKQHGKGTVTWGNKRAYKGTWVKGKQHGYGLETASGFTVKRGFWENGTYTGTTYSKAGCISGNCNNGYGTLISENGDRYIGQFKNGQFNGYGKLDCIIGERYVGEFKNNEYYGEGTLTLKDGSKYIGNFVESDFNGLGTYYYADGKIDRGKWKNGEFAGTAQKGVTLPVIMWRQPATNSVMVEDIVYKIKLCISSKEKPRDIQVFVNDKLVIKNAVTGLHSAGSSCNYMFERSLNLKPGDNMIKVIVKNGAGQTTSETRKVNYNTEPVKKNKRYALVIGNAAYDVGALRNPTNDAQAMAAELKQLGFDVSVYVNQKQAEMVRVIREFGDKIATNKGVGLFFFAGHGFQLGGENYIIPVDAHISGFDDIETQTININRITGEMDYAKNDMNIIILDACRNNPFEGSSSLSGKGLASLTAPSGTIIAFATAPGSTASDGYGKNGLYTQELLKAISKPGYVLEDVFKEVRRNVYKISNKKQTPWENSSLFDNFYFKKAE